MEYQPGANSGAYSSGLDVETGNLAEIIPPDDHQQKYIEEFFELCNQRAGHMSVRQEHLTAVRAYAYWLNAQIAHLKAAQKA